MIDLYADPIGLEHDAGDGHPESPERLAAIIERLAADDLAASIRNVRGIAPATDEELLSVHTPEHIRLVKRASDVGDAWIDGDTHVGPRSLEAARMAAGQCIAAAREACLTGAFSLCAVRPPGHHATPDRPMGFCLFNNVAVAARRVLDEGLTDTVVIVDFDVHHGNGTQDCFFSDGRVFFLSIHQWPHYPGSGSETETGAGDGLGWTANVPVAAGSDGRSMRSAVAHIAGAAIDAARPKVVLVSAGYDADARDPLALLRYEPADFAAAAAQLAERASQVGAGLVCCLEGGYDIAAVEQGVAETVRGMLSPRADDVPLVDGVERVMRSCWFGRA